MVDSIPPILILNKYIVSFGPFMEWSGCVGLDRLMGAGGNDEAAVAGALERLSPARFLSFSFPDPSQPARRLRVAVLDSPLHIDTTAPPLTAAMLVPRDRESDWIFSTESGHLQLLLSCSSPASPLSRLILVGDLPGPTLKPYARLPDDPDSLQRFQLSLLRLLLALAPRAAFARGIPEIPFFSYEDDVARSLLVDSAVGPVVGEMLVEDVEIDASDLTLDRKWRRRLRFKRMPNLVQSQVRLLGPSRPESGSLLQPYLAPMVAGLALIAPWLGSKPRGLCIGVGGGALLMFLRSRLGFDVVGVEADCEVLSIARRHFALKEEEFLKLVLGDGIEFLHRLKQQLEISHCSETGCGSDCHHNDLGKDRFNAVMVDLDAGDARNGVSAPPLEFVQKSVLTAARAALCKHGILVVNVIPQDSSFYNMLIDTFREVFDELYELDVGNGENYVLMAAASPVASGTCEKGVPWIGKLKQAIGERLLDSIKKI